MTGPHTGKTIRMELFELQKADLGRKSVKGLIVHNRQLTSLIRYAKVDRRPLDPPPVVLLKIYEVQTGLHGDQVETETPYELSIDIQPVPSRNVKYHSFYSLP